MGQENRENPPEVSGPYGFQFGLSTLLVLVACCAVAFGLLVTMPSLIAGLIILLLDAVFPAALIALLVYGGRHARAFSLGAVFPMGMQFLMVFGHLLWEILDDRRFEPAWTDTYSDELAQALRHAAGLTWILSVLAGWVSVSVLRHAEGRASGSG